ncbi:MAG: ATP-binding protein, partial [Dehalococcoidia bacterium]|nr:ATP-binding protein [Dehalococcoidia bacterium]
AIEINGQIVKVFDPAIHEVKLSKQVPDHLEGSPLLRAEGPERNRDLRWVVCQRPVIIVGGELNLKELEFQYDAHLRYHQAPLHMKAAGGVLVIDDFGRQRVSPRDLLNRWIVPMDRGVDYLPLPTGETIEVPFDLLLVFSTNLHPLDVVDEAFLRRIRHKVFVPNPTPDQFSALFFKEAAARGLAIRKEFIDHITDRYYSPGGREMRSCHPKDILSNVEDIRIYEGDSSPLTVETLVRAADAYFLFEEGTVST